MKRLSPVLALAVWCVFAFPGPLFAQQRNRQGDGNNNQAQQQSTRTQSFPLWKAELPGGTYMVARNAINAVSSQEYLLDGVARVTEVNISTAGSVFQPRFYYLEMLPGGATGNAPGAKAVLDQAQAKMQAASDQAVPSDQQPWTKVMKNYPTTTHAGTIEFRMNSKEELQALFDSVERVWLTGRSEVYTPGGTRPFSTSEELQNKNASSDKNGEGGPGTGGGGTSGGSN